MVVDSPWRMTCDCDWLKLIAWQLAVIVIWIDVCTSWLILYLIWEIVQRRLTQSTQGSKSRRVVSGYITTNPVSHHLYRTKLQLTHLSQRYTQGHHCQGEGDWEESNHANQPMYSYTIADYVAFGDEECSHFQSLSKWIITFTSTYVVYWAARYQKTFPHRD